MIFIHAIFQEILIGFDMKPPTIAYWKEAFHRLGSECVFCRDQRYKFSEDFDAYLWSSIDHLIPYAARGVNHPDNLVPACIVCNMYKKDQVVDEPNFSKWTEEREISPGIKSLFVKKKHIDDYVSAIKMKIDAAKDRKRKEFKSFQDYVQKKEA